MATKVVLFENKVKIRLVKAIQYVFANSTDILLYFYFYFFIMYRLLELIVIGLVLFYKKCISPFLPNVCRFEPTCSDYMIEAVKK
ncbi:MAG: membrane protein insertion efficiency factor YidD, partial [Planctomycetaceae bacterium]|nr:membrane protein insertion efficiency factor YidD [Planctomycetaceae bacterium]